MADAFSRQGVSACDLVLFSAIIANGINAVDAAGSAFTFPGAIGASHIEGYVSVETHISHDAAVSPSIHDGDRRDESSVFVVTLGIDGDIRVGILRREVHEECAGVDDGTDRVGGDTALERSAFTRREGKVKNEN